jgi:hypothetical protein
MANLNYNPGLAVSPDWKHIEKVLEGRVEELRTALEKASEIETIHKLQGRLAEIRDMRDRVHRSHRSVHPQMVIDKQSFAQL